MKKLAYGCLLVADVKFLSLAPLSRNCLASSATPPLLVLFHPHTTGQPLFACLHLADSPAEGPVLPELDSKHCLQPICKLLFPLSFHNLIRHRLGSALCWSLGYCKGVTSSAQGGHSTGTGEGELGGKQILLMVQLNVNTLYLPHPGNLSHVCQ